MNLSLFASCGGTGGLPPVEIFSLSGVVMTSKQQQPAAHHTAQRPSTGTTIRSTATPWIKTYCFYRR